MSLARVVCVIPARDAATTIQASVAAARALPGVELVIVTDDGSADPTGDYAAASGAIVVTHQRSRGRAAAIESAVNALGVLESRDRRPECGTVLLLDAGLGATVSRAQPLIGPVVSARADLTIAVPPAPSAGEPATGRSATGTSVSGDSSAGRPSAEDRGGWDVVETAAARGIAELAGWTPRAPLATNRCLTRKAYELASPLAAGAGADVGMTIDLLRAGLRISEVEVAFDRYEGHGGLAGRLDRARTLADVTRALTARGLVGHGLSEIKDAGGIRGLIDKLRG